MEEGFGWKRASGPEAAETLAFVDRAGAGTPIERTNRKLETNGLKRLIDLYLFDTSCRLRNGEGLLRTPGGLNSPQMGLLSFLSFWGILVQGTFLPPNGSISNITG